jgi:hypothetical protein
MAAKQVSKDPRIEKLRRAADSLKEAADDEETPAWLRTSALLHRFELERIADELEQGESNEG